MVRVDVGTEFIDFGGNACRVVAMRRNRIEAVVQRAGSRPGRKRFWPVSVIAKRLMA